MSQNIEIVRINELPELTALPDVGYLVLYDAVADITYRVAQGLIKGGESQVPAWNPSEPWDENEVVIYGLKLWQSLSDGNTGNVPATGSIYWVEVSPSENGYTPLWAAGVYTRNQSKVMRLNSGDNKYYEYVLRTPAPFTSSDFDAELAAGDWQLLGGSGSGTTDIATNADMDAGTNDTKAVSPLKFVYGITTRAFSALKTTAKSIQGAINELWDKLFLKQTVFVGVCESYPILSTDVIRDDATRTLTIATIKGGQAISASNPIRVFTDGGGIAVMHEKATAQSVQWSDTKGLKYIYFDTDGVLKSSDTPWQFGDIAPIWRLYWNPALTGAARIVREAIEYHTNTISAVDHRWKHRYGTIWLTGFNFISNALVSGAPNASGLNTCISLTGGTNMDDNLPYTVVNSTTPADFAQDLGQQTAANITNLNAGVFEITYNAADGTLTVIPGTRFPFHFTGAIPQIITAGGVITPVANGNFFNYYLYSFQDPRFGKVINLRSGGQYTTKAAADNETWEQVKAASPTLQDGEVRQLYKGTWEHRNIYPTEVKAAVLRSFVDLRQNAAISVTASAGATLSSSVALSTPLLGAANQDEYNVANEANKAVKIASPTVNRLWKSNASGQPVEAAFTDADVVQISAIDMSDINVGEKKILVAEKGIDGSPEFGGAIGLLDVIGNPGLSTLLAETSAAWSADEITLTGDNRQGQLGENSQFYELESDFFLCKSHYNGTTALNGWAIWKRNRGTDCLSLSVASHVTIIGQLETETGWNSGAQFKQIAAKSKRGTWFRRSTGGYLFLCIDDNNGWTRVGSPPTVDLQITSASHPVLTTSIDAHDFGANRFYVEGTNPSDNVASQGQQYWNTTTKNVYQRDMNGNWAKLN